MARNNPPAPAILCAENVAALHVLHSRPGQRHAVPSQPSPNPVTIDHQPRPADYTLPFEKERSLAGTLAFLAYAKEDNNYIPAVCIEENPIGAGLNVLLAVNRGTENDGCDVLEGLGQHFEEIFSILARMDNGTYHVEKDVFKAIISMCSKRILHRLSLERNHMTKGRNSIKETLQRVDKCLKEVQPKDRNHLSGSNMFIERAKDVMELVDLWIGHPRNEELEMLVDSIYRLQAVGNLDDLFNEIDDRDMHRDSKRSLLNMINKVARYREAARILYRMAKKFPITRKMCVVFAQLPGKAFERVPGRSEYVPTLDTNISSINGLRKGEKNFAYICELMESTETETNSRFAERARKTLREGKIHAEIQLLYHCKLYITHARRPRVVCSSKDACWLCNEFILMYKKVHIPKGHGKLYSGWRLPSLPEPEFVNIATRFNRRLGDFLKDSIKKLIERGGRTIYKDPIESTLLTYIWSTSTLPATVPVEAEKTDEHAQEAISSSRTGIAHKIEDPHDQVTEEVHAEPEPTVPKTPLIKGEETNNTPPPRRNSPVLRLGTSSPRLRPPSPRNRSSNPNEGIKSPKRAKTKYKKIKHGKSSPLYTTGLLEVRIEYAGDSNPKTPSSCRKTLSYAIERLTPDDAQRLQRHGEVRIIDAATLGKNEIDHRMEKDGFFYLASGDTVLRIFLEPVAMET